MPNICPEQLKGKVVANFEDALFGNADGPSGGAASTALGLAEAAINFAISQNYEIKAADQAMMAIADAFTSGDGAIIQKNYDQGPAVVGAVASTAIGIIAGAAVAPFLPVGVTAAAAGAIGVWATSLLAGAAAQALAKTAEDLSLSPTPTNTNSTGMPDASQTSSTGSGAGGAPGCPGVDRSRRAPPVPAGAPNFNDPLVLDIAGAGINLTEVAGSSAYFDYTLSGYFQQSGWISAGMGLLVSDPGAGQVVTATNLLGALSGDGFADLSALDVNGDGKIDASDDAFASLRIWIDADQNGQSTTGELYSLYDLGITEIALQVTPSTASSNGNQITGTASFVINGTSHTISEVNFATNRQNSIVPSDVNTEFSWDALKLPNLDGYGSMPDLRAAMSLDNNLANTVKHLVLSAGAMTGGEFDKAFEQIVMDWAGASVVDPASDGAYVDARHMAVIYAFYGIDRSSDPYYQTEPNWHNGPTVWEPLYRQIINEMKLRFVSQIATSLASYGADTQYLATNPYTAFFGLGFDENKDGFSGDLKAVILMISSQAPAGEALSSKYWGQMLPIVESFVGENYKGKPLSKMDVLKLAVDGQLPLQALYDLAGNLDLSPSNTSGVISITTSITSTIFFSDSQSYTVDANFNEFLLPGYDPRTTMIYRDEENDNLIVRNIVTGSILTITGFFDSSNSGLGTVALPDGSTYSYYNIGGIIAISGAAAVLYSSDAQAQEANLENLNYSVSTIDSSTTAALKPIAYEIGDGSDWMIRTDGQGSGANIVYFANDTKPQDLIVSQSGNENRDLLIKNIATGQEVTFVGQGYNQSSLIQEMIFQNGTVWSAEHLWALSEAAQTEANAPVVLGAFGLNDLIAGSGTVELRATASNSTFKTGAGADIISMGGRGNTYNMSADTTSLLIRRVFAFYGGSSKNVLNLPEGVSPTDISVTQGTNRSVVLTCANGVTITIDNALLDQGGVNSEVDVVNFLDGTSWTINDLLARSVASMEAIGNDTVYAIDTGGDLTFTAGPGDVTLNASLINNYTSSKSVTLVAGPGNDRLIGAAGSTTYVVPSNAGTVTLDKNQDYGAYNTLKFGDGVSPNQIAVLKDDYGNYFFENIVTRGETILEGSIVGDGGFWNKISQVLFADGTVWNGSDILDGIQTIEGSWDDDIIQAPDGNATVIGGGGNDTLIAGDGNNILVGGGGITNFIIDRHPGMLDIIKTASSGLGHLSLNDISSSEVSLSLSSNGYDVELTVSATNQRIRLVNQIDYAPVVNGITFADNVTWTLADIDRAVGIEPDTSVVEGTIKDDVLQAGPGDVTVIGEGGNDTLIAGPGNDTLIGGGGYTTYVVPASAGDVTIEAQTLDPAGPVGRIGASMTTVASSVAVEAATSSFQFGPNGELDMQGVDPSSIVLALGGNGSDVILTNSQTGRSVTIQDEMSGSILDAIVFDNGTIWRQSDIETILNSGGGDGSDGGGGSVTTLPPGDYAGTNGDDTFFLSTGFTVAGALGNDSYSVSGEGSGTFHFAKGDGHDSLDQPDGSGRNDTLVLTDTNSNDLMVTRDDATSAAATLTIGSTGDSFRADWQFFDGAPQGIAQIQFADGMTWDRAEIHNRSSDPVVSVINSDVSATAASEIFDTSSLNGSRSVQNVQLAGVSHDYVQISRDVFDNWEHFLGASRQVGSDIVIAYDGLNSLTLKNASLADLTSEDIIFTPAANIGDQLLRGSEGDDLIRGGSGDDVLIGEGGNDMLEGSRGNDTLVGGSGDDTYLFGMGDGQDTIVENGQDRGAGFGGSDTIRFGVCINPSNVNVQQINGSDLVLTVAATTDSIRISGGLSDVNARVERIEFADGTIWTGGDLIAQSMHGADGDDTLYGTEFADNMTGAGGSDVLFGFGGDDVLDGGAGSDRMVGGTGDDRYYVDSTEDIVEEDANEGHDTIVTSLMTYTLGENVEDLVYSGSSAFAGTGNFLGNILQGGNGADRLDGAAGADVMRGGAGNDTYVVDNVSDQVIELAGQGADRVLAKVSYSLNDNIETLQLTTSAPINGAGNGLDNTIIGNDGANVLSGGAGIDTLQGGGGNDTLDGGVGADHMAGGTGDDRYIADDAGDTIEENANEGHDTVVTSLSAYTLGANLEDLVYSGTGAFTGVGNALDNMLQGGNGADRLEGGAGADTMKGGAGNDTYVVENVGDQVLELANQGTDRVLSQVSFTLSDNIETLQLTTSAAINGTGNGLDNTLIGNNGANLLNGGGGADTITGGGGNDTIIGGDGIDTAVFSGDVSTYSVTVTNGTVQITDTAPTQDGNDGTDTLSGVEYAQFKGGTKLQLTAPILLDMNDNGVRTRSIAQSSAYFDFDEDGVAEKTSWFEAGDGMLFLDRNGDGTVTNAGEVSFIGDQPGAKTDLEGLRAFDTNGDGILSADDTRFSDFRVWVDNGDGIAIASEILTLTQADIRSVALGSVASSQAVSLGDVIIAGHGSYMRADGSTGGLADAFLTSMPSQVANGSEHANIHVAAGRFAELSAAFGTPKAMYASDHAVGVAAHDWVLAQSSHR